MEIFSAFMASSMPGTFAWTIPHATHWAEFAKRQMRVSCMKRTISLLIALSRMVSSSAVWDGETRLSRKNDKVELEGSWLGVEVEDGKGRC